MLRVEFTIEPFHEGAPGAHVTQPAEAIRAQGVNVELGPFGSSCTVDAGAVGKVVSTVVSVAVEHGASHVTVNVEKVT